MAAEMVAARCGLDADSAAALLAAADGDVETALAIHVGYNGGELAALGGALDELADAESAKRARADDPEMARVAAAAAATATAGVAIPAVPPASAPAPAAASAEPLVSGIAVPAAAGSSSCSCFAPVARVNIDGVEGSSIPGGLHLARYGGGDDYRQAEPLLSAWCVAAPARGDGAPGAGAAGGAADAAAAAAAAAAMPGGGLRAAAQTGAWRAACAALPAVTADSLQLLHGFNLDEVLPRGCAPQPGALRLEPRTQLLVSRLPAGGGARFVAPLRQNSGNF